MALFLVVLAFVVGLLGGLTGIGGILIPPLLIAFAGATPHVAMGSTQASFFIPSVLAIWMFVRRGQLDMRIAVALSVGGAPMAFVGANLKPYLDASVLIGLLAVCIAIAGVVMLRPQTAAPGSSGSGADSPSSGSSPALSSDSFGAFSSYPSPPWPALFLLGGCVGLLAGITGSGSNVLLVPAMLFLGLQPLIILAACQFYSLLICFFGTVGNFMHDAVDFHDAFWLTVGQLGGIWCGVRLAQIINTERLKKIMAWVCLISGLFMLGKIVWQALQG